MTPSLGASVLEDFTITTGNDAEDRDPLLYSIYGTNEAIASADNSEGDGENWTLIQSGSLDAPAGRNTDYAAELVNNAAAYTSYRVVFDTVNGGAIMQIAEFQAKGTLIPEPSVALLTILGFAPLALRRRRK